MYSGPGAVGGATTGGAGGPIVCPGGVTLPNKSPVPVYNAPSGVTNIGLPFCSPYTALPSGIQGGIVDGAGAAGGSGVGVTCVGGATGAVVGGCGGPTTSPGGVV